MRGPPVVLTNTLGRPVTNVISERGAVPMTVVNTLGEPVTLVASGGEPVTLFNANGTLWDYPFSLFANNEQGAWYDPSDFSTLFQNSTGTTPVTAVEQPVRLMLDRSRGLVLGSEQRSTGAAGLQGTATAATFNATTFAGAATRVDVTNQSFVVFSGFTPNVLVRITVECLTGTALIRSATLTAAGGSGEVIAAGQTVTSVIQATATGTMGVASTANGTTSTFIVHSVRELPGNHATAPNDASRPVLRARYNQIVYSEQFDNAAWLLVENATVSANATAAPDGTTTADKLIEGSGAITFGSRIAQAISFVSGTAYTFLVFVKQAERNWCRISFPSAAFTASLNAFFNAATGEIGTVSANTTASVVSLANGWFRVSITATATGTASGSLDIRIAEGNNDLAYTGDGTSGIYIWGADLKTAADEAATGGAYQRIAAATDYDTSNPVFRPYLAFDGSDDSLSTSSIDFSGTDEVTLFAGVHKASDAAAGIVAEFSATVASNNGSFYIIAPPSIGSTSIGFASKGTSQITVSATGIIAPSTSVISCITDISSDITTIRVNASQAGTSGGDLGTGNYGNYPLFIGRRNNTNLPFNGRIYGLTVLGRTATAPELSAMEAWVAGKTGVVI